MHVAFWIKQRMAECETVTSLVQLYAKLVQKIWLDEAAGERVMTECAHLVTLCLRQGPHFVVDTMSPCAQMSVSAVVQSALMQDLSCHPTNCNQRERATSETGKLEPQWLIVLVNYFINWLTNSWMFCILFRKAFVHISIVYLVESYAPHTVHWTMNPWSFNDSEMIKFIENSTQISITTSL